MNKYKKPLKVSNINGKRIIAIIKKGIKKVYIIVPYIKEVEVDNPSFSKNGIIKISCFLPLYKITINKIVKYLEDLFLKGILNENINTGLRVNFDKRGNTKKNKSGKIDSSKRERSIASIHNSARGEQSTESIRGRESSIEMDKGNNS